MREILFKAKRKSDGKWVEGYLVPISYDTRPTGYEIINKDGINYDELDYYQPNFVSEMVEPETISQYIGLCDKNGRKIFEGDIVKTKYELGRGGFYVFEVYFNENLCQFALTINRGSYTKNKQYDWLQLTALKSKKIEVIGNVFDNPELLEDK